MIEQVREMTAAAVDAAAAQARDAAPDVRVSGRAVHGEPGPVLVRTGEEAGMVVVGNRGGGGFASLLAGSVSVHVATHAPYPVTVVRGRADNDAGPVIVRVDGSPPADLALNLGFEEAARRHTGVTVVRAFGASLQPWTIGVAPRWNWSSSVAAPARSSPACPGGRSSSSSVPVATVRRANRSSARSACNWSTTPNARS